MARNELKLDAETSSALEKMRNETPVEAIADETVETKVEPVGIKEEIKEESKSDVKAETKVESSEKTVPLAALHETREELKAERKRNEEIQRKADERFNRIMETLRPQPAAAVEQVAPDPERDALGTLKVNQQQLRELAEWKQQQEAEQSRNYQMEQLRQQAIRLESEFSQATPDYVQATQFLTDSRRNELAASGMYQPHQVNHILQNEAMQLAQQAIANGRNPAETIYAIAKARGYTKQEAKPVVTEESKIDRIAQGQDASKSIGQAQGAQASSGAKMDGRTLANMSDEAFEKLYSKLSRGERAALMGN